MKLVILQALKRSLSDRLAGKRPEFPHLLSYRFCLYRKHRDHPLLEAELRWPDRRKRRQYSRLYFGVVVDQFVCYRDGRDGYGYPVIRPTRRTLLADPTRDYESSAWLTLLNHLKRRDRQEEGRRVALLLGRVAETLSRSELPREARERVRQRVTPLLGHRDSAARSAADYVLRVLEELPV